MLSVKTLAAVASAWSISQSGQPVFAELGCTLGIPFLHMWIEIYQALACPSCSYLPAPTTPECEADWILCPPGTCLPVMKQTCQTGMRALEAGIKTGRNRIWGVSLCLWRARLGQDSPREWQLCRPEKDEERFHMDVWSKEQQTQRLWAWYTPERAKEVRVDTYAWASKTNVRTWNWTVNVWGA